MRRRLFKVLKTLREFELNALLLFNPPNITYFSGLKLDYSAILVTEEEVHAIVHVLEVKRAEKAPLISEVHAYSSYPVESEYIEAVNLEDAVGKVVSQLGLNSSKIGFEGSSLPVQRYERLKKILPKTEFRDSTKLIYNLRMVKDEDEISLIKMACEASVEGVLAALNSIKPGVTEMDVAAEALRVMAKKGGIGDVYPIIASGPRSAMPHARASDKKIHDGDFVVIDLCPQYQDYYADITRTVIVGRATSTQRRIYQSVLEAQLAAVEKIRPGVKCRDVDEEARKIIRDQGYGKYFIHSTGHGLGLEIHEPPRLAGNVEEELRSGMVITIEPGIYIPNVGGVRIEDTILVTGGEEPQILTKLSKEILEI